MDERGSLEAAIGELEARRAELGDEVVDAALSPLRSRLAALGPAGLAGARAFGASSSLPATSPGPAGGVASGERKMATVLFADFAGYTRLVSSSDPEHVRELVTAAFEALVPAVEAFGGTLEKFIGDAIMALFGVPLAHGDDARRACLAALAMREALGAFNKLRGTSLELHFGIGTGLVVAGRMGIGGQQGYSAVGNAVNRAARIAALATGGSILVDEETKALGAEGLAFAPLPAAALKGFAAPVALFRLEGEARAGCADEGLPFIGRAIELAELMDAWRGTAEAGAAVLVSGEAGIGKTRLAREAARRIAALAGAEPRPLYFEARASALDRASPLRLWLGLLETLAKIKPGDAGALRLEKLDRLAAEWEISASSQACLKAFGPSAGGEGEEEYREEASPGPAELAAALGELFAALAGAAGLVLILDGLERCDPASAQVLSAFLASPLPPRLLLLLLYRDEIRNPPVAALGAGTLEIRLGALSVEESRALAAAIRFEAEAEIPEAELARAGGNPLFVEELLKRRESALPGEIPSALFGLIAARIDALPAAERESARVAAVLGEHFAEDLLAAAGGGELSALIAEGILLREGEGGILAFRHALFRETIYASLLAPRRRELHGRAARAIKELYPEYAKERPELLAEHWRLAGEGKRALPYYKSAGNELLYRGAYEAALEYLGLGLGLAREAASSIYIADFLSLRGRALARSGKAEEALAHFEEALGIQRGLGNLSRLVQLQRNRAYVLGLLGRSGEAEALLREALDLALAADARKELAFLGLELAFVLRKRGELEAALASARAGLGAAERAKQLGLYRKLLGFIGECLSALGRPAEAAQAYRRTAEAYDLSGVAESAERFLALAGDAEAAARELAAGAESAAGAERAEAAIRDPRG